MAFYRDQHYDNAIQKVRINVGKELNMEKEEDAYVVFREPSEKDVLRMKDTKDSIDRLDFFRALFEKSVDAHNFFEKEGVRMEDKAVIALLYEKIETTDKLIKEYSEKVFLSRVKAKDVK